MVICMDAYNVVNWTDGTITCSDGPWFCRFVTRLQKFLFALKTGSKWVIEHAEYESVFRFVPGRVQSAAPPLILPHFWAHAAAAANFGPGPRTALAKCRGATRASWSMIRFRRVPILEHSPFRYKIFGMAGDQGLDNPHS